MTPSLRVRLSGFKTHCAAVLILCQATGVALLAAEPRVVREVTLSADDFAYYQQSQPVIDNILAGHFSAAQAGVLGLAGLAQPQALVVADVHSTIGIAFGESGRFEAGIAQIERALAEKHDDLPTGLVAESRAYLVHFHAALARFEEAARLLGSAETTPPWLFAKLATLYADLGHDLCAIKNAGTALRLAHAGGPVVSHWASRHTSGAMERNGVLEGWSARLQAMREARSPSTSSGLQQAVCVGG